METPSKDLKSTQARMLLQQINQVNTTVEIQQRRAQILQLFQRNSENVNNDSFTAMSIKDLELLFRLYDSIFFEGLLASSIGKFKFSLSRRMTRSAGMTICPKDISKKKPSDIVIEIRIGVDFFLQYNRIPGSKPVSGYETTSPIEALLLVFEHELCHAVEFVLWHKSSCKGQRFKQLSAQLFGHTTSYHELPTNRKIALHSMDLKLGDTVSFDYGGEQLKGLLYRINKRAVVMVRDQNGTLADKHGNRYTRYYVPLSRLTEIN